MSELVVLLVILCFVVAAVVLAWLVVTGQWDMTVGVVL